MLRFIVWETDYETGARTIAKMIEVIDIRKAWKRIYADARNICGKNWHIGLWKEGEYQKEIKNEEVLPIGNQMRIKRYTRELEKLDQQIKVLRDTRRELAQEIAELGGPDYF